jgi:protein ImuA
MLGRAALLGIEFGQVRQACRHVKHPKKCGCPASWFLVLFARVRGSFSPCVTASESAGADSPLDSFLSLQNKTGTPQPKFLRIPGKVGSSPAIDLLREKIRRLEAGERRLAGVLPFGLAEMDARLPGGGLALGALHEVAGGNGALDGAAAALFTAGIMARTKGQILWCVLNQDLFAPGLAAAGLAADRVIYVEAGDEESALACFEEGLRHGGLAGVVAEIGRLPMTSSRRLQLAAESSGTLGIAIRRWRRQRDAADFGQPTAAATKWRV